MSMSAFVTLPRVLTEPLGGSSLSLAMQRGQIPGLAHPWPMSPDEWRIAAMAVRDRFAGDGWLEQLAGAFGGPKPPAHLARAAKHGVVVTTGQQPGLFGGHLLTLVKALSARALADTLERTLDVPCATVFWAATDDADFIEAASVKIPATGEARTLSLTHAPPPGTPMSRAPIAGIEPLLDAMQACCGSGGAQAVHSLRQAYRDGATIGDAYVEYLRDVLTPLGIAVLDASHPAVAQAARPLLSEALLAAASLQDATQRWNDSLTAAGHKLQVESVRGLSLVFANEGGIKRRIPISDAVAVASSDTVLSPTVLLRPIVEAAIMPTVAYAGGPGEIAYFAQIPPIAEGLRVTRPNVVPRWSTTIVEEGIDKIVRRYGVGIDDLREYDRLLGRLVHERMSPDLSEAIRELRGTIDRATASLIGAGRRSGIDAKIIDGLKAQLALRMDRGERRIVAALKHRESELRRDLGTARASLFPDGDRQERALSFVPFVARYDGALIDRMLGEASQHAEQLINAPNGSPSTPVAAAT